MEGPHFGGETFVDAAGRAGASSVQPKELAVSVSERQIVSEEQKQLARHSVILPVQNLPTGFFER